MKLGFPIVLALAAIHLLSPSLRADEMRLDDVLATVSRELVVRSPFEDHVLDELIHRAQLAATGAEVSLAATLPAGARVAAGPLRVREALALVPADERILVREISGAELKRALEREAARFRPYSIEDDLPLVDPGDRDSAFVSAEGVSYEIDLRAPSGERVTQLTMGGAPLDPERQLRVAVGESVARRLGLPVGSADDRAWLKDALLARLRAAGTLSQEPDHNWSLLPDYATTPERPLIDRLVRLGVAPVEEVQRLYPDQPARRGDLAYWLSRAYGWRESKLSGAFPDAPDSLEPWLDGLVKRRVVGALTTEEFFQPFAVVRLPMALDWCERAALEARYALDTEPERQAFRRALMTGTSLMRGGRPVAGDTLTRAQLLGLIANGRFPAIRVLHTTDFHGAMEPRDVEGRARGGSAVLAAYLARLRDENPEGTVLLDGGDTFQGTMISNLSFGRPVVEQMNQLGYAAMAIGNHEFDWSADTLARRAAEMRFATLGANITEAKSGKRPRWARADTLIHRRGVRVGVFGIAYTGTPTSTHPLNVTDLRFGDDSTAAAKQAPALRKRGAEAVIGLGHVPGTRSKDGLEGQLARLARGVAGVDLWLGGHSHTWIAGEVGGVPAMIPGSHGEGIAVCDLVMDPVRDRTVGHRFRVVETWADQVTPDSAMAGLVARWARVVEREAIIPVGISAQRLGKRRGGESEIGSLVADVMRDVTGADVALQNNGGLRADLPEGHLTRSAIYQVIPFENQIVTMDLSGAEIRRVLEEGLASERIVQVSGIRYRLDLGRPAGSRVTALLSADGTPLDEARSYKVACNDFMSIGGDDLVTLTRGRNVRDTDLGLRQAVEDWVRERSKNGPLEYAGDGRVTREPGSPAPARGD